MVTFKEVMPVASDSVFAYSSVVTGKADEGMPVASDPVFARLSHTGLSIQPQPTIIIWYMEMNNCYNNSQWTTYLCFRFSLERLIHIHCYENHTSQTFHTISR